MAFFSLFFESMANNPLSECTQTLRRCVQAAYGRQGIERDPATHSRPSPTVQTVIEVLKDVVEDPTALGYELDVEQDAVREAVQSLLVDLRPSVFGGGGRGGCGSRDRPRRGGILL